MNLGLTLLYALIGLWLMPYIGTSILEYGAKEQDEWEHWDTFGFTVVIVILTAAWPIFVGSVIVILLKRFLSNPFERYHQFLKREFDNIRRCQDDE